MVCYFHPDRESTNTCEICGKEICPECGLELAGKVYCKECIESIVGLNLAGDKAPKAEEPVIEKEVIPEVEEPIAETQGTPVFKDSASIDTEENPYKIIDDEEPFKFTTEKVPEVKEFSSEPNLFKDTQRQEPPIVEEKAFTEMETPELTSIYEQEKQRTLNDISKPIVDEPEEIIPLTSEKAKTVSLFDTEDDYDIIYPDHSYEPPETSARRALEEKYENYLEDLYFDEEVPLSEQLAKDEEEYGSLTETPYVPIDKENIPLNELYPEDFGENGEYLGDLQEETPSMDTVKVEEIPTYDEPKIQEPIKASVMGAGATGGVYAVEETIPRQRETTIPTASGVYSANEIRSTRDEPTIPAASGVYSETPKTLIEDDQIPMHFDNDEDLENEIRRRLAAREEEKRIEKEQASPMRFLKKERPQKPATKDEKIVQEIEKQTSDDPVGAVDVLLTIILIVVIIVVVFYILYLFTLQMYYPSFTDAIFGLKDPQTLLNNILHK